MKSKCVFDISQMTDEEVILLLKKIVLKCPGCSAMRKINAAGNEALQNAICRLTSFLNAPEYSFVNMQTRVYMLINDMQEKDFPRCIHCGKIIHQNVKSVHYGFPYEACSMKCAAQSEQRYKKIAQTNLKNHGSETWRNGEKISQSLKNMDPQKRAEATKKFKETRQKHIDENPNYWKDRDAKSRETKQKRHGDPNWNNGEQISATKCAKAKNDPNYYSSQIEKGKQTKEERYGDPNWNNKEQTAKTKLEKYGDPGWNNRPLATQTCLERYGVNSPAKVDSVKQTIQQTCLDKYGSTCWFSSEIGQKTTQQTCIERYGTPYFISSELGRYTLKVRHAKDTYKKVSNPQNEVEPLFTVDDVLNKTPLTTFKWRCKKCGNVFASPINFIAARCGGQFAQCLKCHPIKFKPTKQREVYDFIKTIYNGEVIYNDRTQIHPYEIDIYLPQLKIGIEFDGIYWHSAYHGTPKHAMLYKTNLCKQNGISLIHLYEDEWDCKKAQCKAKLAQMLHKNSVISNAYDIVYIDAQQMQDFLNKNSYDLFAKASNWKNIAVVDNRKILAAMALTKSNSKLLVGDFCNIAKKDAVDFTKVLLDFAKNEVARQYGLTTIQLSVDNRWLIASNVLQQFVFVRLSNPIRWLIDISKNWTRLQKSADRLTLSQYGLQENEDLLQFMHSKQLTWIEDCGKIIFQANV